MCHADLDNSNQTSTSQHKSLNDIVQMVTHKVQNEMMPSASEAATGVVKSALRYSIQSLLKHYDVQNNTTSLVKQLHQLLNSSEFRTNATKAAWVAAAGVGQTTAKDLLSEQLISDLAAFCGDQEVSLIANKLVSAEAARRAPRLASHVVEIAMKNLHTDDSSARRAGFQVAVKMSKPEISHEAMHSIELAASRHGIAVASIAARAAILQCKPLTEVVKIVKEAARPAIAAAVAAEAATIFKHGDLFSISSTEQAEANAAISQVLRTEASLAAQHSARLQQEKRQKTKEQRDQRSAFQMQKHAEQLALQAAISSHDANKQNAALSISASYSLEHQTPELGEPGNKNQTHRAPDRQHQNTTMAAWEKEADQPNIQIPAQRKHQHIQRIALQAKQKAAHITLMTRDLKEAVSSERQSKNTDNKSLRISNAVNVLVKSETLDVSTTAKTAAMQASTRAANFLCSSIVDRISSPIISSIFRKTSSHLALVLQTVTKHAVQSLTNQFNQNVYHTSRDAAVNVSRSVSLNAVKSAYMKDQQLLSKGIQFRVHQAATRAAEQAAAANAASEIVGLEQEATQAVCTATRTEVYVLLTVCLDMSLFKLI